MTVEDQAEFAATEPDGRSVPHRARRPHPVDAYRPVDSSVAHCGGAIFTGLVIISYTFRRLGCESGARRHSYGASNHAGEQTAGSHPLAAAAHRER